MQQAADTVEKLQLVQYSQRVYKSVVPFVTARYGCVLVKFTLLQIFRVPL